LSLVVLFFVFQAEDGIRDDLVTGVQTCALPILINWVGIADTDDVGDPDPVDQRLQAARRAVAVRAAVHHLARRLDDLGTAERALDRKSVVEGKRDDVSGLWRSESRETADVQTET